MITPQELLFALGLLALLVSSFTAPGGRARLLFVAAMLVWTGWAWWTGDRFIAIVCGANALVVLAVILRGSWTDRGVGFNPDEQAMVDTLFDQLPKTRARHLIDQGVWLHGAKGDMLTREGEPVDHLYYLAEGEARVLSGEVEVGRCRKGDLVGELTVLSGETASATVVLDTAARFWCAPADDLRPYVEAHEDIRRAIEHGFATVLKAKLRASNRAIAEGAASRAN